MVECLKSTWRPQRAISPTTHLPVQIQDSCLLRSGDLVVDCLVVSLVRHMVLTIDALAKDLNLRRLASCLNVVLLSTSPKDTFNPLLHIVRSWEVQRVVVDSKVFKGREVTKDARQGLETVVTEVDGLDRR